MKEWGNAVLAGVLSAVMVAAMFWALYHWCSPSRRYYDAPSSAQRTAQMRLCYDMGRLVPIPAPQVPVAEP